MIESIAAVKVKRTSGIRKGPPVANDRATDGGRLAEGDMTQVLCGSCLANLREVLEE